MTYIVQKYIFYDYRASGASERKSIDGLEHHNYIIIDSYAKRGFLK